MTPEAHAQALRELLVADHEQRIAEVQRWADDAAAAGDSAREQRHRAHLARLRAMPYPWERDQPAA